MTGYSIGYINFEREGKIKPFRLYNSISPWFASRIKNNDPREMNEIRECNKHIVKQEGLIVTDKTFSAWGMDYYGTVEDRIRRGKGVVDDIHLVEYDGLITSGIKHIGFFPSLLGEVEFELSPGVKRPLHLACDMHYYPVYEFVHNLVMLKDKKKLEEKAGGIEFVSI